MIKQTIECDRCKEEVKNKESAMWISLLHGNYWKPVEITFFDHVELCKKCLEDFKLFMKGINVNGMYKKGVGKHNKQKGGVNNGYQ